MPAAARCSVARFVADQLRQHEPGPCAGYCCLARPSVCRRRPRAGHFFGFPYCHTGPAGGKGSAYHAYNRDAGIGPNIADPDVNANETKLACNGGRPAEGLTLRRL